jgi:hypothetical protein
VVVATFDDNVNIDEVDHVTVADAVKNVAERSTEHER